MPKVVLEFDSELRTYSLTVDGVPVENLRYFSLQDHSYEDSKRHEYYCHYETSKMGDNGLHHRTLVTANDKTALDSDQLKKDFELYFSKK